VKRIASYIDGFNLYFGLRSKGWRKYYWLDPAALSRSLLKPDQQLVACNYFTARIRSHTNGGQSNARQSLWIDALQAQPDIQCQFGHYLSKERRCRACRITWKDFEEKMTDVKIATQILVDAFDNAYDTALIISGDSDLVPPLQAIRNRQPDKRIIVAFPPGRRSEQLRQVAHGCFTIGEVKLRKNLLPDEIALPNGHILRRPAKWR